MEIISVFSDKFLDLISQGVERIQLSSIEKQGSPSNAEVWTPASGNRTSCSYCRIEFTEQRSQREHYKLDWHRYNLKRALASTEPITEEVFFDKNENDDLSSISGSDSEDEGTVNSYASSQGKLFLNVKNERVLAIYKCLLFEKEDQLDDDNLFRDVSHKVWAVLMVGGGHFAGAVFNGNEIVAHKTFHSYTVRAAQGGSQSSKDSGGSHPKSAGASLRRYNEQSFVQHVRTTIKRWEDVLEDSSFIFYRAAGPFSRNTLFGGSNPVISRDDRRLRLIPFSTKRPTFAEVKRVHSVLSNVELYDCFEKVKGKYDLFEAPEQEVRETKIQQSSVNNIKSKETRRNFLISDSLNNAEGDQTKLQDKNKSPKQEVKETKTQQSSVNNIKSKEIRRNFLISEPLDNAEGDHAEIQECLLSVDKNMSPEQEAVTSKSTAKRRARRKRPKKCSPRQREEARQKELCAVVKRGDLQELKSIMEDYINSSSETGSSNQKKEYFVNEVVDDNHNTLLHIAALNERSEIIQFLLENGANPYAKDRYNKTAYFCSESMVIRGIFMRFAKENTRKHSHTNGQIPVLEEIEKARFLKMTDEQKRELITKSKDGKRPTVRCFTCGLDITLSTPFEYMGNKFCTPKCLQEHRKKNPIKLF